MLAMGDRQLRRASVAAVAGDYEADAHRLWAAVVAANIGGRHRQHQRLTSPATATQGAILLEEYSGYLTVAGLVLSKFPQRSQRRGEHVMADSSASPS
ncbi:hypothetical protein Y032_0109g86 [Ancylostoma ceylanicum]|uniref:Uncharacterized protein n=1 Tax=Ancylostoma ceylanicum TaxID=53326 RepID=A0A016TEU4_9BILA|nr:hypothetical protein Y032_0109g86 [Ancylostoma ceylanicum]